MPRRKKTKKSDGRSSWARRHGYTPAVIQQSTEDAIFEHDLCDIVPRIPSISLPLLPRVIDLARTRVELQESVVEACLCRILAHDNNGPVRYPRKPQVRSLRLMIYTRSDVLLYAKTGFGKSLIFHAFTVLTGKITLQLIPLSKLGDEQASDIQRLDGAQPCLLTKETTRAEKALLARIAGGEFTHVLLGPEQASRRAFRKMLREPSFQDMVGLVAIDECHLVSQWRSFRPEITMISELRTILHKDVVWFGCSATMTAADEAYVLANGGFRGVGRGKYHTQVIRTSVDRPDISLSVIPLERNRVTSYDSLYFLLGEANTEEIATPAAIPKTIVFIDGRIAVHDAAGWLISELLHLSPEYSASIDAGAKCVHNIVQMFTARVSQYDRERAYAEFAKPDSVIRIMVATTSLGMGINIPDVERVVTWRIPITESLGDIWQRAGRGGRGPGRKSRAFVFLPYWLFNICGLYKPGSAPSGRSSAESQLQSFSSNRASKRLNHMLPGQRRQARSQLSQCAVATPGDALEVVDDPPQAEQALRTRYWTKSEMACRDKIPRSWLDMVNGTCHRRGFLKDLGEFKSDESERQEVERSECCSACNPDLNPSITFPPLRGKSLAAPRTGSLAAFICAQVEAFAVNRSRVLFSTTRTRFPMAAGVYIAQKHIWELGHGIVACEGEREVPADAESPGTHDYGTLCRGSALAQEWDLWEAEQDVLIQALPGIREAAQVNWDQHLQGKARRRHESNANRVSPPVVSSQTCVNVEEACRQLDNEAAAEVAQEEALLPLRDEGQSSRSKRPQPSLAEQTQSQRSK